MFRQSHCRKTYHLNFNFEQVKCRTVVSHSRRQTVPHGELIIKNDKNAKTTKNATEWTEYSGERPQRLVVNCQSTSICNDSRRLSLATGDRTHWLLRLFAGTDPIAAVTCVYGQHHQSISCQIGRTTMTCHDGLHFHSWNRSACRGGEEADNRVRDIIKTATATTTITSVFPFTGFVLVGH